MPVATIKVGVEHDGRELASRFARLGPSLSRATHDGVRDAGRILIRALDTEDNSSASWQPDFQPAGNTAIFMAHSTSDTQAYQEFGVPRHPIAARRGRALRFFWANRQQVVFFKRVNHPGRTAHPYVRQAGEAVEGALTRTISKEWEGALDDG
jgi:hypothetical protein